MKVKVEVYDRDKFIEGAEVIAKVVYEITDFKMVLGGAEAMEIEKHMSEPDTYHEYLVLYCENRSTATFRNNRTEMYLIDERKLEK